ncbi:MULTISPECIES: MerR family DNA-binding transcriptional regulator [Paenibacillus]|uniref:MerR family DNA-binding transcriptional regulator n=1 Tax=Paenibacillus TaxID=44249 RepID=UPI002F414982
MRYYEKIGLLTEVQRDANGYRQYTKRTSRGFIFCFVCVRQACSSGRCSSFLICAAGVIPR